MNPLLRIIIDPKFLKTPIRHQLIWDARDTGYELEDILVTDVTTHNSLTRKNYFDEV